jgi:hypothetical protein
MMGYQLANLPQDYLRTLERPELTFDTGWNPGREKFLDSHNVFLGSFYANPFVENYTS